MTYRITTAHLEGKVATVNRLLGNDPDAPYSTPGVVILSSAYGGTGVFRYVNTSGGVSDLMGGHWTRREAAMFLDGMTESLYITKENGR